MNMDAPRCIDDEEQRDDSGHAPTGSKRPDVELSSYAGQGHLSHPPVSGALQVTEG